MAGGNVTIRVRLLVKLRISWGISVPAVVWSDVNLGTKLLKGGRNCIDPLGGVGIFRYFIMGSKFLL